MDAVEFGIVEVLTGELLQSAEHLTHGSAVAEMQAFRVVQVVFVHEGGQFGILDDQTEVAAGGKKRLRNGADQARHGSRVANGPQGERQAAQDLALIGPIEFLADLRDGGRPDRHQLAHQAAKEFDVFAHASLEPVEFGQDARGALGRRFGKSGDEGAGGLELVARRGFRRDQHVVGGRLPLFDHNRRQVLRVPRHAVALRVHQIGEVLPWGRAG